MKIAVISDIHENAHNLVLFLGELPKHEIVQIVFLGDFINQGIARILAHQEIPVTAVWGNNDGERVGITKLSLSAGSSLTVGFDTFDFVEFDGRKIFLTHYPTLARPMAKSGEFDAVFYGHDHQRNIDQIGNCLVVNPGEISTHKTGKACFAVYDTATNSAQLFVLKNSLSLKTDLVDNYRKEMNFKYSKSKTHQY